MHWPRLTFSCARTVLALALFAFLPLLSLKAAEPWQEVFDPYRVQTLHLEMDTNDWERIRFDQPSQSESWVPQVATASFWMEGEAPIQVTVRRKGESDIPLPEGDPQKVSLKIDINGLVSGQKWHGLTKLSLENGSSSPLTEGFAWLLHRLAWEGGIYGYEAAYSGWVRLFINGELKGVFVNAEQRDAQFLRNHGYSKDTGTWLYKVDGSTMLEVGISNSPTYQHLCYAPFISGPGKGGGGGCTQPNLEIDLPHWVDIRGFYTLAAVHAFTENRDDLFSHSGKNSYAVDFNPPQPRTRLYFPWDLDTTIDQGTLSIYGTSSYQTNFLMHPWFRRVYEQLHRDLLDGPFAEAALLAAINRLQTKIGPALDEDPYVYPDGSSAAFNELRQWVQTRVPNVRAQLTQPWIPRPTFNQLGGEVVSGFNLTMSAPTGAVYYTLDGTDPRAPGGTNAPSALLYSSPVLIDRTTRVIARALSGTNWSAMPVTATFSVARYASDLRITEIMYNPAAGALGGADEYEFIELKNTGPYALNLAGFHFEGIDFVFSAGSVIAPGAFSVLARNPTAFSNRYPSIALQGVYWGKLSDSGEKIRLRDGQSNTVISVEYDDDPPWPLSVDGLGYSLVLADASGDPDQPETWRASRLLHGSPGADDLAPPYGLGVVINEVLAHTDPPFEDAIELFNSGPAPVDISGWYLSDNFNRTNVAGGYDLKKFRIPNGTVLQPGAFKVYYQRDFQTQNGLVPFALSESGETVYLSSATAAGVLNGYVVGASFGASDRNVSLGRHVTSQGVDFVPLSRTTFGSDTPASLTAFRTGTGLTNAPPRVGPIVINEIMYNPSSGSSEFLELMNVSGASVDVSGWRIAGVDFTFPPGTSLPAQGLVLVLKTNAVTSAADFRTAWQVPAGVPIFAHDFVLENEGEALELQKPNTSPTDPAIVIERVRYNDKSPWPTEADGEGPSLERFSATGYGNDPINWRTVQNGGSPGRPNEFLLGLGVAKQSSWKFHAQGNNLGEAWSAENYSDSSWPAGDGILGYGTPALGMVLPFGPDPAQKPLTAYFRKEFVMNDSASSITNLQVHALYDDGFVLYLNGTEIMRSVSMPTGAVTYASATEMNYNSFGYETFDLSAHQHLLRLGRNVLCAEVHQVSPGSDDLLWDASLTYDVTNQPSVSLPVISPPGGYFTTSVQVTLTSAATNALIYYTLNGLDPDETSTLYSAPFTLETGTQVRARAYLPGFNESGTAVANFIQEPPTHDLTLTVNQPAWGNVIPPNGAYPEGTPLLVQATPATYYRFSNWTGDLTGSSNAIAVVMETNLMAHAVFAEVLTTNYPTPHWWLAQNGYSNNFETAVTLTGTNGLPLWQSYLAGLDPNDATSQLKLTGQPAAGPADVLMWNPVIGRAYTLWASSNPAIGFAPIPGAVDLPSGVNRFTNAVAGSSAPRFYRLEVRKP